MIADLERWRLEGLKRAAKLRLEISSINEAAAVIENVFGDDWIQEACQLASRGGFLRRHPIGHLLVPPGENQISGLLELVEYLKAAASSPVFPELVLALRAQYGPTFLQLAAAHRLRRLGAIDVEFEPPVKGGRRGDLLFRLDGEQFVAECYIPRVKPVSQELHWLLQQALAIREGSHPSVLSIAIKLKGELNAQQRKIALRLVRELAAQVDEAVLSGKGEDTAFVETDAALISVARTRAARAGEFSVGRRHPSFPDLRTTQPFVFGRISVALESEVRAGYDLPDRGSRDHLAIWLSDEDEHRQSLKKDLDEPLAVLTRKLERKLAQTKLDDDTYRLLIVSSWITQEMGRASSEAVDRLRATMFLKHSRVAGLLLLSHPYQHDIQRRVYQFEAILPEPPNAFTHAHLRRLRELEHTHPIPPVTA